MSTAIRHFARSRCPRALSVFAWLMLVLSSTSAMTMPASVAMTHAANPMMHAMAMTHAMPAAHHAADTCAHRGLDCCSGHAGLSCHCASMCATALASAPMTRFTVDLPTHPYALPAHIDAPSLDISPPLRPPTV